MILAEISLETVAGGTVTGMLVMVMVAFLRRTKDTDDRQGAIAKLIADTAENREKRAWQERDRVAEECERARAEQRSYYEELIRQLHAQYEAQLERAKPGELMSTYRCAGCRNYFRRPEFGRAGLGSVCSAECAKTVRSGKRSRDSSATRGPTTCTPTTTGDVSPATRGRVSVRDKGRCRYCGTRATHLHHILYRSQGGSDEAHNLITRCPTHHALVHSNKSYWQRILRAYVWITCVEGRAVFLREIEHQYA